MSTNDSFVGSVVAHPFVVPVIKVDTVLVSATVSAETRARDSVPGLATAKCVSSVSATFSATAEANKIGFGRSLIISVYNSERIIKTGQYLRKLC